MKGPQFRKGHVVTEEDIPMLLSMGKDHLYVWHLRKACCTRTTRRRGLRGSWPAPAWRFPTPEGKIELTATCDGLFRVDAERLFALNSMEGLMAATRHDLFPVRAGDKLCGTPA
jgi:hypothetical protein